MPRTTLVLFCASFLLAGCALPGTVAAPTPYPPDYIPTVIFLTAQSINATVSAGITPTPTFTPSPTPVPATSVPTSTATAAPGVPLSAIQISAPGPMSRIVSPVELHAMVAVRDGDKVEIGLYDETGQIITHPPLRSFSQAGEYPISLKMPFEIRAAGETGVIQVSIKDSHGRLHSVISIHVLLLSDGASQINPAGNIIYERAVFYGLPPESTISGGTLAIKGRYEPLNNRPVILELDAEDGSILGQRVLDLSGKGPQAFDTTIPYQGKVAEPIPARLMIYQDDDIINGHAYFYSQPITVAP